MIHIKESDVCQGQEQNAWKPQEQIMLLQKKAIFKKILIKKYNYWLKKKQVFHYQQTKLSTSFKNKVSSSGHNTKHICSIYNWKKRISQNRKEEKKKRQNGGGKKEPWMYMGRRQDTFLMKTPTDETVNLLIHFVGKHEGSTAIVLLL